MIPNSLEQHAKNKFELLWAMTRSVFYQRLLKSLTGSESHFLGRKFAKIQIMRSCKVFPFFRFSIPGNPSGEKNTESRIGKTEKLEKQKNGQIEKQKNIKTENRKNRETENRKRKNRKTEQLEQQETCVR